jgi:hypothetical protein
VGSVPEIGKPERERCLALGPFGCTVYSARPAGCAAFECVWHTGELGEADRPDKIGVMFFAHVVGGVGVAVAHEVNVGAGFKAAAGAIEDLSRLVVVALEEGASWRLYGAAEKVERVRKHLARGSSSDGPGRG